MTGSDDAKVTLLGRIKEKLIAAKQKTAREKRLQSTEPTMTDRNNRLPPGQRLVDKWPVLDLGLTPKLDLADWRLTIDGLVEVPVAWGWDAFQQLPQSEIKADIHCVTTWSLFDSVWGGITSRDLLSLVQPKPEVRFAIFRSYDGYSTNVPLAHFAATDSLLAHHWNHQPIGPEHGGPARMVIPGLYFWKSAKWVRRISFVAEDVPGYWETRGYHNDADPWREERYS